LAVVVLMISTVSVPKPASEPRSFDGFISTPQIHRKKRDVDIVRSQVASQSQTNLSFAPQIARTADLELATTDLTHARAVLEAAVQRHQGFIGNIAIAAPQGAPRSLNSQLQFPHSK